MKSIRCPQCELVNFATLPNCKRCQHEFFSAPNNNGVVAATVHGGLSLPHPAFNRIARRDPNEPLPEYVAEATPIGGWLIAFAISLAMSIGLCALFLPEYIKMLSTDAYHDLTTPGSSIYISEFNAAFTLEFIWLVVVGIGSILLLIRFFRKSSSFPRMAICILALNIVVAFLDYLMGMNIQHQLAQKLAALSGGGKAPQLLPSYIGLIIFYSIVSSICWIIYFLSSRRVESTFIY